MKPIKVICMQIITSYWVNDNGKSGSMMFSTHEQVRIQKQLAQ